MATVRMKRGEKYADIFDSTETIAQAKADGYELVAEKPVEAKKETEVTAEKPARVGRPPKQQ